ncbi:MAG: C1 family peptidase [Thermodesulfobacteriota bacterium]|nr:C1 family peptidase [Thermodesulfobacteriota bacterium]
MRRLNAALIICLGFFFGLCGLVQGTDLPTRWDWRNHNGVTAVRNQGSCGSCWAFASAATMESAILINDGSEVNLSEQHLVSCNLNGWGCGGGWIALPYYLNRQDSTGEIGTVMESCFAYLASNVACTCAGCDRVHELLDWGLVPGATYWSPPSDEQLKTYIYTYGPIFAALDTHTWCLLNPSTGASGSCSGNNGECNHAILIVGWDDDFKGSGNGCWIIKNSWNTWWQDGGFGYVKYGTGSVGTAASWVEYYGAGGLECDNAIDLTPYHPYDGTTVGGASRVDAYSCDDNLTGPEKVHRITTTTDGDIAATLSNHAVNLDVLILSACDSDTCYDYASGTGSITATYPNAPAGTYYIVVDGSYGASGSYTLTVATGLDCASAVSLSPRVAYDGNTSEGPSMIHSYTGTGGSYENMTGPESLHKIIAFKGGGDVTATLNAGHASGLEVFIVRPCDPASCLAHASGTGEITATYPNAPVGTYFIVVDGSYGASGSYTLTANALWAAGKGLPWVNSLLLE